TGKQIEGLEFVFIELPKFKPGNRAEKKLHELWLRFLTEINERTEKAPEELMENEEIREAIGYMEVGAYTKAQLVTYDKWKIDILTERSFIDDALEKGEAIGEAKNLKKVITNGLRAGFSVETLSTITGLTPEEVMKIREENK
ncbi:MAG: PD-(D/E)XK nuclease family transposase, partial [Candidatus Azobacteroides sp.]|nr:PD-(D/E)XK nuclease family transposase [Candidatus Azobacteroides sp.]